MFELNDVEYTLEQIQKAATDSNMDVNAYIDRATKESGLIDKRKDVPGKITPPKEDNQGVPAGVNATPEIQPTVTELPSEDISLDLVETAKTGTVEDTTIELEKISEEKKEEILSEYDRVSSINIEQETEKKIASKLKRFNKGVFKIEERKEFDYWKDSKGDLFESSKKISLDEFEQIKQTNQTLFLNDLPNNERVQIYNEQKNIYENEIANLNKKFNQVFFSGVSFDSRSVKKNNIFFAIKGNQFDGNDYIGNAIKKGAKIIVSEKKIIKKNKNVIYLYSSNVRKLLSEVSYKILADKPQKLIAVTGTNGKSSIADFYYQILNLNLKKVASVGTLGVKYNNKNKPINNLVHWFIQ